MISANAQGLKSKVESLKSEIKYLNAAIFTIQESHFMKKGKLKIENFEMFEAIRKKHNGGTIIGVNKALRPMLINEYSDEFKLVIVDMALIVKTE